MQDGPFSRALVSALDAAIEAVGNSTGVDAAQIAVAVLRSEAGASVFPSVYRLDNDRLWLIAQAGYSGVYDGIGLDRGVMATAAATGESQFVAHSADFRDYLYAQPGFVSEVTAVSGDFFFNIETKVKLDAFVVEPVEKFTAFLAARLASDPSSFTGPIAHALGPMLSLRDPALIAEYAARVTATQLGLDIMQTVILEDGGMVTALWRNPSCAIASLADDDLEAAVQAKRSYASWIGPSADVHDAWAGCGESVVVPIVRRGKLIGGLVGAGPSVVANAETRATLSAVSTHTAACLERASLETSLLSALADRSRFMAAISHEIRTPMTAVSGYADLLLAIDDQPDGERSEFLAAIKGSADHVLALIGDLLEVARAEAGELRVDTDTVVDLTEVLHEAIHQVQPQASQHGIDIVVNSGAVVLVFGDRLRIRQIIVNVLSNAVKFTKGGSIRISVETDAHAALLRVVDDGDGISSETLETLFQPFTGRSVNDPSSGTGLGLVISRRLAEAMGGQLALTSDGIGLGATATLKLPLASDADVRSPALTRD